MAFVHANGKEKQCSFVPSLGLGMRLNSNEGLEANTSGVRIEFQVVFVSTVVHSAYRSPGVVLTSGVLTNIGMLKWII